MQRSYQTHLHNLYFKILGLELTIERSYQTHSLHRSDRMTGLYRRLRRRNMFWSRMHCCYIVIGGGFKEKHILEQGEVFSSGLKEKNVLCDYVKKCRRNKKNLVLFSFSRAPYPFLLLRDPGLLINLPKNRLSQYWSFSFSTNSSNEYSGLLSFRINC